MERDAAGLFLGRRRGSDEVSADIIAPMEPRLTFACFACGQELAAAEHHRGRSVRCPRCQTEVTVPPGLGARTAHAAPALASAPLGPLDDVLDLMVPIEIRQLRQLAAGLETHQARVLLIVFALLLTPVTLASWVVPQLFRAGGCVFEGGAALLVSCFLFFVPLAVVGGEVIAIIGHKQCGGHLQSGPVGKLARTCFWLESLALILLALAFAVAVAVMPWNFAAGQIIAPVILCLAGLCWVATQLTFHLFLQRVALDLGDTNAARWAIGTLAAWLGCLFGGGVLAFLYLRAPWALGDFYKEFAALAALGLMLGLAVTYAFVYAALTRLRRRAEGKMR